MATTLSSVGRADPPSTHGMLLFGDKITYASHLPMFHSPHNYQLLLKLTLTDRPGAKTLAAYAQAKANATTYFTLVPEVMDLTKLISGAKTDFTAEIYLGHFERGGQTLGAVNIHVDKIVFSAKLDGYQTPTDNKFIVFGENGEYFAAHLIKGEPNFDSIVSTKPVYTHNLVCHKRFCLDPDLDPIADQQLPMILAGPSLEEKVPAIGSSLGDILSTFAEVQKVIYFEDGDLKSVF